ncbi:MAG: hypothetical protein JO257_12700 [Deltaproteobacteria bacterium]|nr:hypothetical protein [Deltaproteobacteria bacterium]
MKTCLVLVAALAACGSKKPAPATPPAPAPSEPATPVAVGSAAGSDAGSAAPAAGSDASASGGTQQQTEPPLEVAKIDGKTYKDLDKKGRAELMKKFVLPKAKELFAAFDPTFPEVTCKTCHGDGVADHSFKMPNPKIKQLPGTEKGFVIWVHQHPEEAKWAGFMGEKLEPAMGQLMGMTVFNPKTGQGELSCNTCHVLTK